MQLQMIENSKENLQYNVYLTYILIKNKALLGKNKNRTLFKLILINSTKKYVKMRKNF